MAGNPYNPAMGLHPNDQQVVERLGGEGGSLK